MEVRDLRISNFFLLKNSFLILELFATQVSRANLGLFANFDGTKKPTSVSLKVFHNFLQVFDSILMMGKPAFGNLLEQPAAQLGVDCFFEF